MNSATFFLIIITLVAVVLIAVGIYLILVLHEARISLRRFNNVLKHLDSVLNFLDHKVVKGTGTLIGFAGLAKEVLGSLRELQSNRSEKSDESRPRY